MTSLALNPRRINTWLCENGCGTELNDVSQKNKRKRYCEACREKISQFRNTAEYRKIHGPTARLCKVCHISFIPKKKKTTKYCSRLCNIRALHGNQIFVTCGYCGNIVKSMRNTKYCSKRCKWTSYYKTKLKELEYV